ncbi:LssY C-terminal domain-containing protein [Wolbachia endosymbiont of Ctenocephalides felis wCfeT]|uniref:LssY C-terminal domain-containing protein n=1 Tax=Wolbachia endosymbiont of Ctenocephalides felis wCfeT TaxID=2732593 RepID=UPI001C55407B|nr:LssY C-terminal domain-containing protein [Wolbachia endosymbiont of Ctenocephalides felis wCfeT]
MKNSRIAGDPINIVIVGSKEAIHEAFTSAGWSVADKLTLSKKRLCCIALWIGGNA